MAVDFDALVVGPCLDTFGEEIIFTSAVAGSITISGVFTEAYTHLKESGNGMVITAIDPMLGCRATAFPAGIPVAEDEFTIGGVVWRVVDVLADSHGHLLVQLMKAG